MLSLVSSKKSPRAQPTINEDKTGICFGATGAIVKREKKKKRGERRKERRKKRRREKRETCLLHFMKHSILM